MYEIITGSAARYNFGAHYNIAAHNYVIYSSFALVRYDSTGMFHWTPARAIEDCVIVSEYFKILLLIPWKKLNLKCDYENGHRNV